MYRSASLLDGGRVAEKDVEVVGEFKGEGGELEGELGGVDVGIKLALILRGGGLVGEQREPASLSVLVVARSLRAGI